MCNGKYKQYIPPRSTTELKDACELFKPFEDMEAEMQAEEQSTQEVVNYSALKNVLDSAYQQASTGKGRERHASDEPFEDQLICVLARLLKGHPFAGPAQQALKKIIEAGRLYNMGRYEQAHAEHLGAINYTSAVDILMQEGLSAT